MSKYVKKQDSNDPWLIDESNQFWMLGKKATISVTGEAAINIAAGSDNNTVNLRGDVDARGAGSEGLHVEGNDTIVEIATSSIVKAEDGIYNTSTGSYIENSGIIHGKERGIASDSGIEIVNDGEVTADAAITIVGEGTVTNLKGGMIDGGTVGIRISTFGAAHVENYGKIVAEGLAVHVNSAGDSYLRNDGKIVGDVQFGSGNDTINNVEGRIVGLVSGGLGHDNYYVGESKVALIEHIDGGYDEVYSYATRKLGANFEAIYLLGDEAIGAKGNSSDNVVHGNVGNNVLRGKSGADRMEGSMGNDALVGGAGPDTFVFRENYGRDTVVDFDAAEDYLAVIGLVDDFDALAQLISQHGDDTWISFGGGDRLVLKGIDASEVTEDVVVFNVPM